ncbi:cytochrome C oxidase subunit IV family protein [Methylobacterium durans]|uniref:cytochrome C oxidase subunit IV family protein n=1 Tax=Methylobacterium durans TaxID=2202825 RepID=UPI002AFF66AA|nr:cytochrome C oxidase subunit IV family protein [Methylobacterium durans]MEA1834359.1 cytochrome C oxidase subunit IV family protein [Methylobacterium durans]
MSGRPDPAAARIWVRPLIVWAGLMALLALTVLAAYAPLGALASAANLGLAAVQAGLVAVLFMRLDEASPLVRLTAATGLFWLAILFALCLADVLSRLANA